MKIRTNIKMREGIVAMVQLSAFAFLIFSVGKYGLTSLNTPTLLGIILLGELIDRISRVIKIIGTRKEDPWKTHNAPRNHYPREPPILDEQGNFRWPNDYPAKH